MIQQKKSFHFATLAMLGLAVLGLAALAAAAAAPEETAASGEAALAPAAKMEQVVINNNRGLAFAGFGGALDGTEIRRFPANALRIRYTGNVLVFDALDGRPIQFRDDQGTIRMVIDPTPTATSSLLQLRHDSFPALSLTAGGSGTAHLAVATANGLFAANATIGDTVLQSAGDDLILNGAGGAVRIDTGGGGERVTVLANGNVGIGVVNPEDELEVNGTTRTREVIVTQERWPDHVFNQDYPLLPLEQLERLIEARGHLPGVPSAAEAAEHGVAIGDMQATLLEKIEELTLYVIALNKDNVQLRAELEQLSADGGS